MLDLPGIVDPKTGRILTVGEAIKMHILDVRTGEIILISGERVSLTVAAQQQIIDPELCQKLINTSTMADGNGKPLSLLEAIQIELIEAENGYESAEKRIKVITTSTLETETTESLVKTIADAIKDGTVDPIQGLYRIDKNNTITITEAYERGLLVKNETVKIKSTPLCLADAIGHNLVDNSGWVVDRNSGDKFRLDSAIANALIIPELQEIVDTKNDMKVTVTEALIAGLLNAKTGRYINSATKEKLTFIEAKNRQLICKPMTLKDVCDRELMDRSGRIISSTRKSQLNVQEAIASGILDGDSIKSVTKCDDEELLTLNEALDQGIINLTNEYLNVETNEKMSIHEAVDQGFISSVSQKSIFDIDGFKDPHSGDFVSLNIALSKDLLVRSNDSFKFDSGKNKLVKIPEGIEQDLIRPEVIEMLNRKIGVFNDQNEELSVFDLVLHDLIDPKTGYLLDTNKTTIVPLNQAIEKEIITPEGALLLSSLLNITLTTETVTKFVKRYITIANTQVGDFSEPLVQDSETIMTSSTTKQVFEIPSNGWFLIDAIEQNVFDPETGVFTIPSTDRLVIFEECISLGLINPKSLIVIDPKYNQERISVHRAFEKRTLDTTGHYRSKDGWITMAKAIELGVIILTKPEDISSSNLSIAESLKPDFIQLKQDKYSDYSKTPEISSPEPLELSPGVIYDPSTALVISMKTGKAENIIQAVKDKTVSPNLVHLIDQESGEEIPIDEAIKRGLVSPQTGEIIDKNTGKKISLIDAVKIGLLVVAGAPLVAAVGAINSLKMVFDPSTNQHIPIELAYERGLVSRDDLSDFNTESIPKSSMISNNSSFDIETPKDMLTPSKSRQSTRHSSFTEGDSEFPTPTKRSSVSPVRDNELNSKPQPDETTSENVAKIVIRQPSLGYDTVDELQETDNLDHVKDLKPGQLTITKTITSTTTSTQVSVTEALQRGLLDLKNGTYTDPKTNQKIPIQEAVNNGSLICNSDNIEEEILNISPVHERSTSEATSTSSDKMPLLNSKEIPSDILEALERKDKSPENDRKSSKDNDILPENDRTSSKDKDILPSDIHQEAGSKMENDEAINLPQISTNKNPDVIDDSSMNEPSCTLTSIEEQIVSSTRIETVSSKDNEAPEEDFLIRDVTKSEEKPVNKNTENLKVTPEKPLRRSQSPAKDPKATKIQNTSSTTGTIPKVRDINASADEPSSGSKITGADVANAAKLGMMAIVGAPILAGMAVAGSVKNLMKKSDSQTEPIQPLKNIKSSTTDVIEKTNKQRSPTDRGTFAAIQEMSESGSSELSHKLLGKSDQDNDDDQESERMLLSEAISQDKIEPQSCKVLYKGHELPSTVQELLADKKIDLDHLVDVVNPNLVILLDEITLNEVLHLNENITADKLIDIGAFDKRTGTFVDQVTGNKVSFEDFIYNCGVFDPELIYVKDLANDNYVPLGHALEKLLIDKNTGIMVDSKTGKRIPFFECLKLKWIIQKEPSKEKTLSLQEARESGMLNENNGQLIVDGIPVSIAEALSSGILDIDTISVRDPSGQILPLSLAIEKGLVDLKNEVMIDPVTGKSIPLEDAFKRGNLIEGIRNPISLEAAIRQGIFDKNSGCFLDGNDLLDIQDSISFGIIDPNISQIKDTKMNIDIPLQKALDLSLFDINKGLLKDTAENEFVTLDEALKRKLISTTPIKMTLIDVLVKEYYKPNERKILNPMTGEMVTLEEGINTEFIDINPVLIVDESNDKVITAKEAIDNGLIDAKNGCLVRPELTLDNAYQRGYILNSKKPISLSDAILRSFYDPVTGLLNLGTTDMTLEDCIENEEISTNDLIVHDPKSNNIITVNEAIKIGLLDAKNGCVNDPFSEVKLSLNDAVDRGIIILSKRRCSLPDAVFKGLYDPQSGTFASTVTTEKLSTERAIKRGFIDPQSTIVNIGGKIMPFELSVENGMVDTKKGTITDEYGNKIDFREAFDRGILVEVRKPIGLYEALVKNIFDETTGKFINPQSGKKLSLSQAIVEKLIDPNSVQIKDTRAGLYKEISLVEAIESGVIDDKSNVNVVNKILSLKQAFDMGILSDNKAPISIQRAIHQGIYDSQTGKIIDPATDKKMTLHEAMRRYVINPQLPCYFNETEEKLLTLSECCRLKLIDRREGVFKEPGSNVFVPLNEALALGLIVDIESAGFGLYEMLAMKLYVIDSGKFINPVNNRLMTLEEACLEDLISPISSLVKDTKSGKYMKLDNAIDANVIDNISGVYVYPNDKKIDLQDARNLGLIVSNQKLLSIENAIRMGLYRPDLGQFVDPSTNELLDLETCIDTGLLDGETTVFKDLVTGQDKPIKWAIECGDIDVSKGRLLDPKSKTSYGIDTAFNKGLLVTVQKPMTSKSFERHESFENILKAPLTSKSIPKEMSLNEALEYNIINPDTAVIKDPKSGKFRQLAIALKDQVIDLDKRIIVDPKVSFFVFDQTCVVYAREPESFDNAVESGHLDLLTGKYNANTKDNTQVCTLKEAITQGLIDPESALIKDGAKQKLIRLPEAFRKGLIDSDKFNVVDTSNSKLLSLKTAIDEAIIITPKRSIDLLEALKYNLYNPSSGNITDPFIIANDTERQLLTLQDAIARGLIDPSTTMVKSSNNSEIAPLNTAIANELVDPINGRLITDKETKHAIDLLTARDKGLLLPAEQRVSNPLQKLFRLLEQHTLYFLTLFFIPFFIFRLCFVSTKLQSFSTTPT